MLEAGYDLKDGEKGHQITKEELEKRTGEFEICKAVTEEKRSEEKVLSNLEKKAMENALKNMGFSDCDGNLIRGLEIDKND